MNETAGFVVCRFDDLAVNSARRFDVAGRAVAVIRIDDDVYAIGDRCSHADISLSEGELFCESREIECWKHGSLFSIETGEALTLPATQPVPVFVARVVGGDVVVDVSDAGSVPPSPGFAPGQEAAS